MKDQFLPYELTVKLKELGFDEPCFGVFKNQMELSLEDLSESILTVSEYHKESIPLILWQQAFDFLLKKYNLYGILIPTVTMYWTFKTTTVVEDMVEVPPYKHVDGNDYHSIEQARLECLKN